MKKCPYCAEEIQDEAILCRFCGSRLDVDKEVVLPSKPRNSSESKNNNTQSHIDTEKPPTDISKKRGTNWGASIAIAIILSILAAIPKMGNLVNVIEKIQTGQYDALVFRMVIQDIGFHLIGNAIIWTFILALLFWLIRNKRIGALIIVIIGIIGITLILIDNPDEFRLFISTNPTPIHITATPGLTKTIKPTFDFYSHVTPRPTATSVYDDLPNMNESQIKGYCLQNATQYSEDSIMPVEDLNKYLMDGCIDSLTRYMDSRK